MWTFKLLKKEMAGFTILETLIGLALTSIVVSYSFKSLDYVSQLFSKGRNQSAYVNNITEVNRRFTYEEIFATKIVQVDENLFRIYRDTVVTLLSILPTKLVFQNKLNIDSIKLSISSLRVISEKIEGDQNAEILVKELHFESSYGKMYFKHKLVKEYDAMTKLEILKRIP